jgi:lysozyme family protein
MANFEKALERVLEHEGGFQKHSADRGNYNSKGECVGTNWGISAQTYESWLRRPPTLKDMKDMTRAEAGIVYKGLFWTRIQGDAITSQPIADILFDGHVNHGITGIRILQRVLGVTPDGKVGNITLGAIRDRGEQEVFTLYKNARIAFYNNLVKNRPALAPFLTGWLRRINSFTDFE